MCTIMASTGSTISPEEFETAFARTKYRGPDDTRIEANPNGIMGFHRLSIMGLTPEGMQPFTMNGWKVVCNGEVYGFEKIKRELIEKGYTFMSGSDCEILLPMFFE